MADSISKDRFGFPASAGKPKLATEFHIIGDPVVYMTKKIIEIRRGYEPIPNYFRPVPPNGIDRAGSRIATGIIPCAMNECVPLKT